MAEMVLARPTPAIVPAISRSPSAGRSDLLELARSSSGGVLSDVFQGVLRVLGRLHDSQDLIGQSGRVLLNIIALLLEDVERDDGGNGHQDTDRRGDERSEIPLMTLPMPPVPPAAAMLAEAAPSSLKAATTPSTVPKGRRRGRCCPKFPGTRGHSRKPCGVANALLHDLLQGIGPIGVVVQASRRISASTACSSSMSRLAPDRSPARRPLGQCIAGRDQVQSPLAEVPPALQQPRRPNTRTAGARCREPPQPSLGNEHQFVHQQHGSPFLFSSQHEGPVVPLPGRGKTRIDVGRLSASLHDLVVRKRANTPAAVVSAHSEKVSNAHDVSGHSAAWRGRSRSQPDDHRLCTCCWNRSRDSRTGVRRRRSRRLSRAADLMACATRSR